MATWRITPVHFGTFVRQGARDFLGRVTKVHWTYNPPSEFEFETPLDDPAMAQIPPDSDTEVAIYRDDELIMVGKPTTRRCDSGSRLWKITVKDPMWYVTRRYNGDANRTNLIQNGDFETGTAHWGAFGDTIFAVDTARAVKGIRSAKLVAGTGDNYIAQSIVVNAGSIGILLLVVGWFRIQTFVSPSPFGLGLVLQRQGNVVPFGTPSTGSFTISADTPRREWQRAFTFVQVPPNVTEFLTVKCYCPEGEIRWDAVQMVAMESLSYREITNNNDISYVVGDVIRYAQGAGEFAVYAPNKSYLGINVERDVTTVTTERAFQMADHQPLYEGGTGNGIVDEYMKMENGVDLEWDYIHRRINVRWPAKGRDITDEAFLYHCNPGDESDNAYNLVVGWTYGDTIETTANDVVMIGGWGGVFEHDPTREEGTYLNAATLGGLTLEEIDSAPQGAPIGQLNALARGRGKQTEYAIRTPQIMLAERRNHPSLVDYPLINVIFPGDVIRDLDIVDGRFELVGAYRIIDLELDVQTEILTATINPA